MDKLPSHFREKWTSLCLTIDPTQQTFAKIVGEASGLSDNPDQGQTFSFANGALISYSTITQPFLVYGDIYEHWKSMGGLQSGYGYPIADPQFLPDGSVCTIFQGGHAHKRPGGNEVQVEVFPSDQCPAPHKPPLPAPLSQGSLNWPNNFRERWTFLSVQRDPYGKQLIGLIGAADTWPYTWPGLTENDNGGKTLHFASGKLVSYDFRSAPVLIYGKIHSLWDELNGVKSGFGHPLADPQILEDGSICSIFEGGHIHQVGTRDAEIFPAHQCTAQNQPALPPILANATPYWPQHFRQKWTALSLERDPYSKQLAGLLGPTDCWPYGWPGLTDNENGGKTLHFRHGRLISNTFQSPPLLIYGGIFDLWKDLNELNSGFGYPLADPQILEDGSVCSIFEGGHIHKFGSKDAEIVPERECTAAIKPIVSGTVNINKYWPVLFRNKWASLAWKRDASGKQLAGLLGPTDNWPYGWAGFTDNEDGGKTLHFRNGVLISYDNQTPPYLLYGNIYEVWKKLGETKSQLKYPLADPQFLPDESICSVFEGGHIHQPRGAQDADMFPADQCTAPYKPTDRTSQPPGPVISTIQAFPSVTPVYQPSAPPLSPVQTSQAPSQAPGPIVSPIQASPSVTPVYQPPAPALPPVQTFQAYDPVQSPIQASPSVTPAYQSPTYPQSIPPPDPYFQTAVQNVQPPIPPYSPHVPSPYQDPYSSGSSSTPPEVPPNPPQGSHTYIGIHSQVTQQFTQPPVQQQQQQYFAPHAGLHHGSKRKMVGAGIRMLGTGINRFADAIDKQLQK